MGAFVLALLELTFVMVSIMLLHSLKRSIGNPAFYLALGMFFVLGQIISSTGLLVDPGIDGLRVSVGSGILLAPYMVAILVVYVVDGTLEAQRMILGMLAILFAYFYLANITASQCTWNGYTAVNPDTSFYAQSLFLQGRRTVVASFMANGVDLFVLPIVFQLFHNRNCRLFFSVLGTLVLAQVIDSFVFQLISTPELGDWWVQLRMTYLGRALAMVWLSFLTTIYLHMCNVERAGTRRPLDILIAFFGSYGRAQELQKYLREWEGRYQVVVQNTSDLIFILDEKGEVLNANDAALVGLGRGPKVIGQYLPGTMREQDGSPCDWQRLWAELNPAEEGGDAPSVVHREWQVATAAGGTMLLDANASRAQLHEKPVAVVIARDVTERRRLEQERERLQEQLLHSQRMEGIGQLAGGVAHDFNNLLHTIQGSLERLTRDNELTDTHVALLGNIGEATERASSLTSQLLGFARKGKYRSERLDVVDVMSKSRALFEPVAHKNLDFRMITAPTPMYINGDSTQLQQVFLNLLLNARDAVQERGKQGKIVFRAEPAATYTPGWEYRVDENARPDDYACIRIKDDGVGIPEEVRSSIFDPFFTTKGVGKGTGMGLAMAYGCVGNHNGWIHVESREGKGTEFFIFLPQAQD